MVSLPKTNDGLVLVDVADQYRALTGTLIIWTTLNGPHPLRYILQSHIGELSQRRWGSPEARSDLDRVTMWPHEGRWLSHMEQYLSGLGGDEETHWGKKDQ